MNVSGAWSQQALYELAKRIILSTQSEPYIDNEHLSTLSAWGSVKTDKAIKDAKQEALDYTDELFANAGKLTAEMVNEEPTVETAEVNVLYYYSLTQDSQPPYRQFLKINETTLLDLGTTEITLTKVVDNLSGEDKTEDALSAAQGYVLDNKKVDKQQGVENAGKAMVVGEDGLLSPSTIDVDDPAWVGTRDEFEHFDHSELKDGQQVIFTDDYENLINDAEVSALSTYSSKKIDDSIKTFYKVYTSASAFGVTVIDGKDNTLDVFNGLPNNSMYIDYWANSGSAVRWGLQTEWGSVVIIKIQKITETYGIAEATMNNGATFKRYIDTSKSTKVTKWQNETTGMIKDTRNDNKLPSWYFSNYPMQVVNEFKSQTKIGIPGGVEGYYAHLTTYVCWTDPSAHIYQVAYTHIGMFRRSSVYQGDGWSAWTKIG